MSFRDIKIERNYINHGADNFVDKLLNPALKEAVYYRRSAGFFSSGVLSLIINSLSNLINKNGKIKLLVSPNLNADDIETIQKAYSDKKSVISSNFINNFSQEISQISDDNLRILYYLVVKGILDIKVAVTRTELGMYHDKLGILTDAVGHNIVFYGSPNSSVAGYQTNYERIRVISDLDRTYISGVNDEIKEFDSLWNNTNKFVEVYNFMDSVKTVLKYETTNRISKNKSNEPVTLRDYQLEAISKWEQKNYNGFFVMATGTGKTWTAIYGLDKLMTDKKVLSIIACPYKHLVEQWAEDITKKYRNSAKIIKVSSENSDWINKLKNELITLRKESNAKVFIVTTIKSFGLPKFQEIIDRCDKEKVLVVDEAHRFTNYNSDFAQNFKYRLGLSATPFNGKNWEKGNKLIEYFGGLAFKLTIEDALSEKRQLLVPYEYHPIFVPATDQEEEEFNSWTRKIGSCFENGKLINEEKLRICCRQRVRVIALASNKISYLTKVINDMPIKDHFIVYCGDGNIKYASSPTRHIDIVKEEIDKLELKTSQFTATENIARRLELVNMFNTNTIDCLVAIRCLDEGINIPSIKSALIMSSNDDYREFVQRRGRILRKYKGKDKAYIYDLVVMPEDNECQKMAVIELRRLYEYARLSINFKELLPIIEEKMSYYGIKLEDINTYDIDEHITERELDE